MGDESQAFAKLLALDRPAKAQTYGFRRCRAVQMGRVDSAFAELPMGSFSKLKVNADADTQTASEHRRSLMRPSTTPEPFPYGRPASGGSLSLFPPKKGSD